jgi:hypothetical protein
MAHRLAWEFSKGPIPFGLQVLHRCDNPPCFNPRHLFLGTHEDNMADRTDKQRGAFGNRVINAKLTPEIVRQIRILHKAKYKQTEIAEKFGVQTSAIFAVVHNVNWRWVK